MNNLTDVTKHLFYSAWILTIIQLIRVAGVTLISIEFSLIIPIADIAFDCALILFGIGMLRLEPNIKKQAIWKIAPIMFFVSAFLDILSVIIHATSLKASWTTQPLVYLNLSIVIVHSLILVTGFIFLKFNIDHLTKNEIIERKGQFLLGLGFLVNLVPSIFGWYGEFVGETAYLQWQQNLAFYIYLFGTFLILLGFLGLASTMKLLQVWSHEQEEEIVDEGE